MQDKRSNTENNLKDNIKECIACRTEIHNEATFCPHCSNYQSKLKNNLRYFSNIITLFTALAALIVFIIAKSPELKKIIYWEDRVNIISYNSSKSIVITNNGDGEIFLSHLRLEYTIEAKDRNIRKFRDSIDKRFNVSLKPSSSISIKLSDSNFDILENISEKEWIDLSLKAYDRTDDCYSIILLYKNDPRAKQLEKYLSKRIYTIPAKAFIYYYSIKKDIMLDYEFPVIAVVGKRLGDDCVSK
jgi:hypothetical protein